MDTERDSPERIAGLGPRTPAARRRARVEPDFDEPPPDGPEPAPEGPEPPPEPVEAPVRAPAEPVERPPAEPVEPIEPPDGEIRVRHLGERAPEPEPDQEPEPPLVSARTPSGIRDHATVALAVASAFGVAMSLAASLGSSHGFIPGGGAGIQVEASRQVVAPGGRIALSGSDVPGSAKLVLETRSRGGGWRPAGATSAATADGDFRVEGRVAARPGKVMLRARAPGLTTEPVPVTVRPLRLAAVGDINLGDVPGQAIAAEGPRYPWESTGARLRSADIAFGNLECVVSKRGAAFPKQFNFRAAPGALAGLRRHSGIDVLNLANNHTGDYGRRAMLDTVRGVERLGMRAVGAGGDLRRALAPQIVERLGLKVAFVGFSEIAPIEFAAAPGRPGTAWADPAAITRAVRDARVRADLVVATFHWGIEKQTLETARQRELAQAAVDAGAQLVIGAHPHTLQPVRRQGPALIAFSLGNFVFGTASPETSSTGILELDLTAEGTAAARWRAGRIAGGRPLLDRARPERLPLGDALRMSAGVNL
jgi:poly-gamma-glutamate capsule biosynthesis protein CapA/YwtB (metallophosphatase superfamily)